MTGSKDLTHGPIKRQLINLALPIIGTSFVQMTYALTDMAWLGRLGSAPVAVAGSVGILIWMTNSISSLNKVAAEVNVAQCLGRKDIAEARAYASHNTTLGLLIAIVWGILLIIFARPIIGIYGLSPEITDGAVEFLRIVALGFPFLFISASYTGVHNAAGLSKIPFYINGLGLLLNIVIDPVFIYLFNLGTAGAACATVISYAFVCALFIIRAHKPNRVLGGFPLLSKLTMRHTLRIVHIGLPVAILNSLFAVINLLVGRTASLHGGHIGLMTLTAGGQIEGLSWQTSQGFSTALSAFVAQNHAAGRHERVRSAYHATLAFAGLFGLFCSLVFIFFGGEIFSIIVPEPEAYRSGGIFLRIDGYSMILMMLEITMQGIFYGIGRSIPPAMISISFNLIRIPLASLLATTALGLSGVWWAISITSMAKGIASFLYYYAFVARRRR